MSWFLEHPAASIVLGVVLGVGLGIAWTQTGKNVWLYALAGVLALTVLGVVVEQYVVTDREAIEATLDEIARDVESNDLRAVLRHIASTAPPELQQTASAEMPNYEFDECYVTKVYKLEVDAQTEPRKAVVEFNVVASGSFSQGGIELSDAKVLRWVQLRMIREKDGRWTVEDYRHKEPDFGGMLRTE